MAKRKKDDYEGLQEKVRTLSMPPIDVWKNKYTDRDYDVTIDTDEFTCICPKTGLPDFASLHIVYVPAQWCIELKSLKLYLTAYRDVGIFHEHVTNKILDDCVRAARPKRMTVAMEYHVRGGIVTRTRAEFKEKENG